MSWNFRLCSWSTSHRRMEALLNLHRLSSSSCMTLKDKNLHTTIIKTWIYNKIFWQWFCYTFRDEIGRFTTASTLMLQHDFRWYPNRIWIPYAADSIITKIEHYLIVLLMQSAWLVQPGVMWQLSFSSSLTTRGAGLLSLSLLLMNEDAVAASTFLSTNPLNTLEKTERC